MSIKTNSEQSKPKPQSLKNHIVTFIQGLAIGAANAIPGVSGGTLALVFGIYEELIDSIKALGRKPFWQSLLKFKIADAYKSVNGTFLILLVSGAVFALLSLAKGLEWAFINYTILILSFFFGLIIASILPVSRYISQWNIIIFDAFLVAAVLAYILVGLAPANLPNSAPILFLSGILAASAMIVPGVSGSFILVLLGNYQYILNVVNERDLGAIAIIGAGAVIGLLSLAQLLSWLFKRYKDLTLAVLAGFMLGSLRKIWPYKTGGFEDTEVPQNILPQLMINGTLNTQVLLSFALMLLGIVLVIALDWWGKTRES